jgi:hypothetical protein
MEKLAVVNIKLNFPIVEPPKFNAPRILPPRFLPDHMCREVSEFNKNLQSRVLSRRTECLVRFLHILESKL